MDKTSPQIMSPSVTETVLIMYGCMSAGIKKKTTKNTPNKIRLSPLLTASFVLNEERFLSLFNDSHASKENC